MSRVIRLLCDCNAFRTPLVAGATLIEGTHLASHGVDQLLRTKQAELYVEPAPPAPEPEPVIEPELQPEPTQDLPAPAPLVGRSKRKKR